MEKPAALVISVLLRRAGLVIQIQATDTKGTEWLTDAIQSLRGKMLSGQFTSYLEKEGGIESATLILTAEELDLSPAVRRDPKGLLN